MKELTNTLLISCAIVVVLCAWKMVNMVWLRPKKLEKILKSQGFNGNKYKLFYGDIKEMSRRSKSKHIDIDNGEEVLSHVVAFAHQSLQKHGNLLLFTFIFSTIQTFLGWTERYVHTISYFFTFYSYVVSGTGHPLTSAPL